MMKWSEAAKILRNDFRNQEKIEIQEECKSV